MSFLNFDRNYGRVKSEMKEKPTLLDQHIIDCINVNFAINVTALSFLPWGADNNAWVYKATASDQASYFIKLKRGHHLELSTTLTKIMHDAGITQIIPPLITTHGNDTQFIDDYSLTMYPFIDAHNGFDQNLTDSQWVSLGKALRQVHEMAIPLSIQNQIPVETYSPQWRLAVRELYLQMETERKIDEIGLKLRQFMKVNHDIIHQLVNRAEQLAQQLQEQPAKYVLCHSDIHGGNVLIDHNDRLYIVDWDAPIMASIERDLMFIGAGVANVWNKPHEEELFYQGYGKIAINKDRLAYYRHERIVEDIAIYGQALILSTAGGTGRQVMYKDFMAMFEPNGVVDIALKG